MNERIIFLETENELIIMQSETITTQNDTISGLDETIAALHRENNLIPKLNERVN